MTKLTICMYGAASNRINSIYINAAEALGKEIAKRRRNCIGVFAFEVQNGGKAAIISARWCGRRPGGGAQ